MSRLFPSRLPQSALEDPLRKAECRLYTALEAQLGDDYRVFYSVTWLSKERGHTPRDNEADFVIVHETRGIVVLEVKGGQIAFDAGKRQWTSNSTQVIDDPVEQARRNKYGLRDKLKSLPGFKGHIPALGHAVAFPDCAAVHGAVRADLPREIVVYSEDLDWIATRIESIFDYWEGESRGKVRCDPAILRLLDQLLARDFELKTSLGSLTRVRAIATRCFIPPESSFG